MLYVAITPWFVWLTLLPFFWGVVAWQTRRRAGIRSTAAWLWVIVLAVQMLAACAAAVATHLDSIDRTSCYLGVYGWMASVALTVVAALLCVLVRRDWPRDAVEHKPGFAAAVSASVVLSVAAILCHLRSAVLCTV